MHMGGDEDRKGGRKGKQRERRARGFPGPRVRARSGDQQVPNEALSPSR